MVMAGHDFIALDTETYHGKAFLLSCPHKVFPIKCFADFIIALESLDSQKFVFYNIDYDVSALVKHLSRVLAGRIYLNRDVSFDGMTIRYIPGKVFRISTPKKRLECFDLLPFFQTSLNNVSLEYLGRGKKELPKNIIENLSPRIYAKHKELIDSYAIEDARLLQDLCEKFYASVESTGVKVKALYSPGYLAKRYLRYCSIRVDPNPIELKRVSDLVYYGGRIEVTQRGYFSNATIYDLKSAYPWALRTLPNFGRAKYYVSDKPETEYYLAEVSSSEIRESNVAPFAQRKDGIVFYPNLESGTVWVTSPEFESTKADAKRFLNLETNDKKPFQDLVDSLFQMRTVGGMESLVYKLILNSLYGILAETRVEYKEAPLEDAVRHLHKEHVKAATELFVSIAACHCPEASRAYAKNCMCDWCHVVRISSRRFSRVRSKRLLEFDKQYYLTREEQGRTSNKLLAAFVTGIVRAEVFKMAKIAGPDFIGCFTDSLLVKSPVKLTNRVGIGAWEKKYDGSLLVVGSGIYETDDYTKFRGYRVPKGFLRELLNRMDGSTVQIAQRDRQSLGKMIRLSYDDYDAFNIIKDTEKKFDLNFDRKRIWPSRLKNGAEVLSSSQTSEVISTNASPYSDVGF